MTTITVTSKNFKKMAKKLRTLKPETIVLGLSLTNKQTRWFIKQIAESDEHYEEIRNEYECTEMAKNLTPMKSETFAKAISKTKSWNFLYNYTLTGVQIECMLQAIQHENSVVESLDLVDVCLYGVPSALLSHTLLSVKKVHLHNMDPDQLLAFFDLIVNRDSDSHPLQEITFLYLWSIPNNMDKTVLKSAAEKVSIKVHSLPSVIADLRLILQISNEEQAWRLTRLYDYHVFKTIKEFHHLP